MSLILDALKKSEAERRRGLPPTLHMPYATPRRTRRTPWAAGAGAVLLAAGLAGGWMWMGRGRDGSDVGAPQMPPLAGAPTAAPGDPAAAVASEPTVTAAPSAPEAQPAFATSVAESAYGGVSGKDAGVSVSGGGLPVPQRAALYTPSAVPVAPPTTVAADPVTPTVAPPEPPAPPVTAPAVAAESTDPTLEQKPEPTAPASAAAIPAAAPEVSASQPEMPAPSVAMAESPAKPEEALPDIYQLPYATRKELPKLNLTMHVYSPVAEERFIVLNGKRYTLQSAAPGPELSLLDINADGAVLEFRGQRFLLPRQTF